MPGVRGTMLPEAASRMISFFQLTHLGLRSTILLAFQLSSAAGWLCNSGNTAVYLNTPLAPETACRLFQRYWNWLPEALTSLDVPMTSAFSEMDRSPPTSKLVPWSPLSQRAMHTWTKAGQQSSRALTICRHCPCRVFLTQAEPTVLKEAFSKEAPWGLKSTCCLAGSC